MTFPASLNIDRRTLLSGMASIPVLTSAGFMLTRENSLRSAAGSNGIRFGASAPVRALDDESFVALLLGQCDVIAAQNEFKWTRIEAERGKPDFAATDRMTAFGLRNRLWQRGHAMIWDKPGRVPAWVEDEKLRPAEAGRLIVDHVRTLGERYRGTINSWDVVNEAVRPGSGKAVGGPLYRKLGWEFATLAFRTVREADRDAQLTYNDYVLPGRTAHQEGILRFLDRMAAQDVKIDALGIQGHLRIPDGRPDWTGWRRFLGDIAGRGMAILVTELDVVDDGPQQQPEVRDRMAADRIGEFLDVTLDERAVEEVVVRSLSDKYEGLSYALPREDGARRRPSPFDATFGSKPIHQAILAALRNAPARGSAGQASYPPMPGSNG